MMLVVKKIQTIVAVAECVEVEVEVPICTFTDKRLVRKIYSTCSLVVVYKVVEWVVWVDQDLECTVLDLGRDLVLPI